MSWILRVVLNKLVHDGILNNGEKHLNGHKFKFKKNILNRDIFSNIELKDRIYECSRCKINLIIYRDSIDNKLNIVVSEGGSLVFTVTSCNQTIMKRACS